MSGTPYARRVHSGLKQSEAARSVTGSGRGANPPSLSWLAVIGGIALLVRLAYILSMDRLGWAGPPTPDSFHFMSLARALLAGRGFAPDAVNATDAAFRPPLYVFFLSGVFGLFGDSELAVRVIQALLGAGSALLVAAMAARIFGRKAAWLAGLLVAFHPHLVLQSGWILSESLFTFLYLAALFFFVQTIGYGGQPGFATSSTAGRDGRWPRAAPALAGLSLGLSILCRPTPMLAIPILAIAIFLIHRKSPRPALARAAVFGACCVLVVAPWIIRGRVLYHAWIPVSTNGEFTLYLGNSPGWAERVYGNHEVGYGQDWDRAPYQLIKEHPPGWFTQQALHVIAQDPRRFARFCVVRAGEQFKILPEARGSVPRRLLAFWSYTILFPIGMIGLLVALRRRDPMAWTLLVLAAALSLVHIVSIPDIRYRAPLIDALLPIYSGGLLAAPIARLARRARRRIFGGRISPEAG